MKLFILFVAGLYFTFSPVTHVSGMYNLPDKDSVDLSFDVREMAVIVDGETVPWYVVFDSVTWQLKDEYQPTGGSANKAEAIKRFGEKYRKGVKFYQKKKEGADYEN